MKIIIDEYNLGTYQDAFLVMDDKSFIEARKNILDSKMDRLKNNLIVITSQPYSAWFYDIENENYFSFERILPSKLLLEKYNNVDSDKDIDEEDIISLELLNEAIEPTELSIVNKYIGSFLFIPYELKEQLYHITSYVVNPHKKFSKSKYLQKKWFKYLDKIDTKIPVIKSIINKIKENDVNFCRIINQLLYVSNSKFLLKECIHDEMTYLVASLKKPAYDLEKYLMESKIKVPINEKYETKIERHFKRLYKEDVKCFFKEESDYKGSLVAFLSLVKFINNEEKEIIISHYRKNIDFELEEIIRNKVKRELSAPPDVKDMALLSQVESFQKWAIETFIPFKFYLDEFPNDQDKVLVENYANIYSDWFLNSYKDIIQSGLKTNYNITGLIHNELSDSKIIWLIIDGFPCEYADTLISVLKTNGINKINENYHFAAIPTITEIGIPTQIGGKYPQSHEYTTDREYALKLAFNSKNIIFKNSIKDFAEALESDFDICCLHWQDIDEFMHKDDKDIEVRRIDEIKRLLNNRIVQIANIIKSSTDSKIKLIISSDHGSTKCLEKGQRIKNSSLLEACKDNPKQRCIELTGDLSNAKLDENEIYYLKTERTLNTRDWVVAKGYRYFGRFDFGYRHGGITPEETIVPFLICEIAPNEIIPIKVIGGMEDIQLGFTESIRLIIKNDNNAIVDIHQIIIPEDKNFNIIITEKIQPLSAKTFEGKIKLPKSLYVNDGKVNISVYVTYSIYGEKLSQECSITVSIKKSGNESLDDLII